MDYFTHPLVREEKIEKRTYQEEIIGKAAGDNLLVVLPTGLGKTPIALLACAERMLRHPGKKALFLAPTKPLVEQHKRYFERTLKETEGLVALTGKTPPEQRKQAWKSGSIFFCTPEIVENDVLTRNMLLDDFSIIIFDESHRAMGDYAYVFIAKQYMKTAEPRILGLTASPGGDKQTIQEVCRNLFIKKAEIRTEKDKSVKPYLKPVQIIWESVELTPDMLKIKELLEKATEKYLEELKQMRYLRSGSVKRVSKKDLLKLQGQLMGMIQKGDVQAYTGVSKLAASIKAHHALELLETQGIYPLQNYLERLKEQKSKAVASLFANEDFTSARLKAKWLFEHGVEHPKMERLRFLVRQQIEEDPASLMIVFTQYRDTVNKIIEEMRKAGIKAERLVGQSSRIEKGMSQKEQSEVLRKFADLEFNLLVASSVGEEGLDLPSVAIVFFFEPIPSELRSIQRRGRTARHTAGKVVILTAKNTRDEAYRWASAHRETKMRATLKDMQEDKGQKSLGEYAADKN